MLCLHLDRHPAQYLRHSCEERESVVGVGDRLVCDTGSSACHQVPGLGVFFGEVVLELRGALDSGAPHHWRVGSVDSSCQAMSRIDRSTKQALARNPYPARALLEPEMGFEPMTYALRVRCSAGLSYPGGGSGNGSELPLVAAPA